MTAGCGADTASQSGNANFPNIVLFLVDDLGWRDVSYSGSDFYETPNIDQLAASGAVFENAYAAHPVCSPTRAALMTGRDPARIGITDWIPGYKAQSPLMDTPKIRLALPLEERTLAELLKDNGYRTGFVGKWHLGETEAFWPEYQGFDLNIGGHNRGAPPGGYYAPYKNPRLTDGPKGEFLTERLGQESRKFITDNSDAPFFLMHSFYSVHTPIQAAPGSIEKYERKAAGRTAPQSPERYATQSNQVASNPVYAGMVEAVDNQIGKTLAHLKALNLDKNTIIVFASDNGGLSTRSVAKPISPTTNAPLRAGKGWLYEGGIRVPFIIKATDVTPGMTVTNPTSSADIFPTLLDFAGIAPDKDVTLDGLSLASVLQNQNGAGLPDRALIWHYPHYHGTGARPGTAIRHGDWKLIRHYETDEVELFNLKNDPYETLNLAEKQPAKVEALLGELKAWSVKVGAKFPSLKPLSQMRPSE